jgi:putative transposase
MANSYSQIYIQIVFSTHRREPSISSEWRERLHRYITGIIQKQGNKLLAINSRPDHIHIFIGANPAVSISDTVRDVKRQSTAFIRTEIGVRTKFSWQEGFAAFSYSRDSISNVIRYIQNQEEHHRVRSFREEYVTMLEEFDVDYLEEYLFDR